MSGETSRQKGFDQNCFGGDGLIEQLKAAMRSLKTGDQFAGLFLDNQRLDELTAIASTLQKIIKAETECFNRNIGYLSTAESEIVARKDGESEGYRLVPADGGH